MISFALVSPCRAAWLAERCTAFTHGQVGLEPGHLAAPTHVSPTEACSEVCATLPGEMQSNTKHNR